jgi:hypothetical protein
MIQRRVCRGTVLLLLAATAFLLQAGCEGIEIPEPDKNKEPETEITRSPADSSGAFYRVHLFWKGFDSDGVIQGFEYAVGDTARRESWVFTNRTDSLFVFNTATDQSQVQRRYHRFFVRAIDNEGKEDPSPATVEFFAETQAQPRSILSAETVNRVAVKNSVAYVAAGANGLDVFGIGDPGNIRRIGRAFTGGNASDCVLDGDYVYLADGPEGVTILDVSDPYAPRIAARYPTLGRAARGLAFRDPYLFVADGSNGILVLDVSVPEDPVLFARYRPRPSPVFTGIALHDDLVFCVSGIQGLSVLRFRPNETSLILLPLPEEDPSRFRTFDPFNAVFPGEGRAYIGEAGAGLLVLRVNADGSVSEEKRVSLRGGNAGQMLKKDERLYVANGFNGVWVLDVANPDDPVLVNRVGYSGIVTGIAFAGDDTLVVCNGDRGIALLDVSDPSALDRIPTASVVLCPQSPADGETLLAFSSAKFCWSGVSPGGQVVAYRYQLQGINSRPVLVPPESTSVFYQDLPPEAQYVFSVETKDETGLWSASGGTAERRFTVNFDPETTLDSIWVTGPYTDAGPIPLTAVDTLLPDSTFIHFTWSHTDRDTVRGDRVVGSWWSVSGVQVSADSLERVLLLRDVAGPLISSVSSFVLEVGGIDSYGRRESRGAKFPFQINNPPDVRFLYPEVNQTVITRDSVTVRFQGIDRDGPPSQLIYEYKFRTADNEFLADDRNLSGLYGTDEGVMQIRLPTFGKRGRVVLDVLPVDRAGRGKTGPQRTLQFFVNY